MKQVDAKPRPATLVKRIWLAIRSRSEFIVPVLGLVTFRSIASSNSIRSSSWQNLLLISLAVLYIGIVLWKPMRVPDKQPASFTRRQLFRGVKIAAAIFLGGALLMVLFSQIVPASGDQSPLWFGLYCLLGIVFGGWGFAAERTLSNDLLPVIRRREPVRIIYVLTACFFLAILAQLWTGLTTDLVKQLANGFGETGLNTRQAASGFDTQVPIVLLAKLMIGAGLFEELLFRMGILTVVWTITRRFSLGLFFSALLFGLYHISPLSGIQAAYLTTPVTAVVSSFMMGIFMGLVYRYRGLTAAVLVHGLGDWILVMLLAGG